MMIYEPGHPDITLSEWETFLAQLSRHHIDEVIDRDKSALPEWYVPLARGVAIASDHLLPQGAYRRGFHRPRDWRHVGYSRKLLCGEYSLLIRECGGLWTVERVDRIFLGQANSDDVLVQQVGSTPIFTRDCDFAMRLAKYSNENRPPRGLVWIKACPFHHEGAIALARKRRVDEALARQSEHSPVAKAA